MKQTDFRQEDIISGSFESKLVKRLLLYLSPYQAYILLSIFLLLLITITDLARPYIIKIAIDEHLLQIGRTGGSWAYHSSRLFKLTALFFFIVILNFGLSYWQAYILQLTGQKIISALRRDIFAHLLKLPLSFFDQNPVGRLVTRVTNDVESLNEMYSGLFVYLFKDLFLIIGIIIIMLKLHLTLALTAFTGIPLIIITTMLYQKKARTAYRLIRVRLALVNSFLQEHLSGMRLIQIFHREQEKMDEFKSYNRELYAANMQELLAFALFRPGIDLIYALILAIMIWYGGGEVLRSTLTFGVLYAFLNYLEQFFRPINDITEKYGIIQSALASAERIFQLLDEKNPMPVPEKPRRLGEVQGKIEFDHVWFAYRDEEWVLKDVTFTVEPGETFALVGATGAGKTSIISLINRLYDVQRGEIRIDGIPLQEMDLAELRGKVGVVMQDVFLFSGTVAGNIALGNSSIGEEKIREAAQQVHAASFIEGLPGQYAEQVVERGATLSTGQRQLLAFARALAYNPAILLLDEATANIDTETEQLIQDALHKLTANRSTIIIAHRLSTVQHANRILVFHRGRIVEAGSHQELLVKKGFYYQLYQLQYQQHQ